MTRINIPILHQIRMNFGPMIQLSEKYLRGADLSTIILITVLFTVKYWKEFLYPKLEEFSTNLPI